MSYESRTAASALLSKRQPARRPRDAREGAQNNVTTHRVKNATVPLREVLADG